MPELTAEGRTKAAEVAARHGVSAATAEMLLVGLAATGGGQVQFSIPELGGMGQWSRGGMVMVGDMFNNALKAKVDALCAELAGLVGSAGLVAATPALVSGGGWWPADLGVPASAGAQNDMAYAFFPAARRLAVRSGGAVTVYDTGDHVFGGFGQQQGMDRTLTFSSQLGTVRIGDLRAIAGAGALPAAAPPTADGAPAPAAQPPAQAEPKVPASGPGTGGMPVAAPGASGAGSDDVFGKIERLAELRGKGILSEEEFAAKKAELLARL